MTLQEQIAKANSIMMDGYHIVRDGAIVSTQNSFVMACTMAEDIGGEAYNSYGDRVYPESDDNMKFEIYHEEFASKLTSANTLEFCNQGSNAYPPIKARSLRIGETLKSSFNDERYIKRVS